MLSYHPREPKLGSSKNSSKKIVWQYPETVTIDNIIEKCESSLEERNLCVVTIHPQEYSTNINNPRTLSINRFNKFKEMLDRLQELDAEFSTFNELVVCSDWGKFKINT